MKFVFLWWALYSSLSFSNPNASMTPEVSWRPRGISLRELKSGSANLVQVFTFGKLKQNHYKVDLMFTLGSHVDELNTLALFTRDEFRPAKLLGKDIVVKEMEAYFLSPRGYKMIPAKEFIPEESGKEQAMIFPLAVECGTDEKQCEYYITWDSWGPPEGPLVERVTYRVLLTQRKDRPELKLEKLDPDSVEYIQPQVPGN